jgi:hypothetical protein
LTVTLATELYVTFYLLAKVVHLSMTQQNVNMSLPKVLAKSGTFKYCPNTTLSKLSSLPAKSGTLKYDPEKLVDVLAKSGTLKYDSDKCGNVLAKSGTFKY